jgi:hypothetical protein
MILLILMLTFDQNTQELGPLEIWWSNSRADAFWRGRSSPLWIQSQSGADCVICVCCERKITEWSNQRDILSAGREWMKLCWGRKSYIMEEKNSNLCVLLIVLLHVYVCVSVSKFSNCKAQSHTPSSWISSFQSGKYREYSVNTRRALNVILVVISWVKKCQVMNFLSGLKLRNHGVPPRIIVFGYCGHTLQGNNCKQFWRCLEHFRWCIAQKQNMMAQNWETRIIYRP